MSRARDRGARRAYGSPVDPALLRAFAQRDREAVARQKRAFWADRCASSPLAALEASGALHEHVRALRPDYPTAADREADLAHHVALKRLLDQASRAIALR